MYLVNCCDCEYSRVGETTFDAGNADLLASQHELNSRHSGDMHSAAWVKIFDDRAKEALR